MTMRQQHSNMSRLRFNTSSSQHLPAEDSEEVYFRLLLLSLTSLLTQERDPTAPSDINEEVGLRFHTFSSHSLQSHSLSQKDLSPPVSLARKGSRRHSIRISRTQLQEDDLGLPTELPFPGYVMSSLSFRSDDDNESVSMASEDCWSVAITKEDKPERIEE